MFCIYALMAERETSMYDYFGEIFQNRMCFVLPLRMQSGPYSTTVFRV